MNKDSIANTVSFVGLSTALMDVETLLTIILLLTGIALNVIRILKNKD